MAARSVLLSGQYNRTCTGGVGNVSYSGREGSFELPEYPYDGRPHLRKMTLPEVLRNEGYFTGAIGKWHIHSWPHDIGFDSYLIPRVHHCHIGQSFTENGGEEFVPSGYSVDFEMDRVEDFLNERSRSSNPFFLYYNISPPHCPLADAPQRYLSMYHPENVPLRPHVDASRALEQQDYWFKVYRYDFRYYSLRLPYADTLPDGYSLRHLIAEYYGLTTWVDDTIGRLASTLERTGLRQDTIVVFTADHGDNLGSHGLVQKGTPNDESIRIPYIVNWPAMGSRPAVIRNHVPSLVDIGPTLLDLIGTAVPCHMQGVSFASVLRGESESSDRAWSISETGVGTAIRTPYHMMCLPTRTESGEGGLGPAPNHLYDMVRDPYQMRNLAADRDAADNARDLAEALQAWDTRTPWMERSN